MNTQELRAVAFGRTDASEADRRAAMETLIAQTKEREEAEEAAALAERLAFVPKVGDGASFTLWTDTIACTVIKVSKSGKTAWLQEDDAELLNGVNSGEPDALEFHPGGFAGHTSGRQRYKFSPNPAGQVIKVTKRADGRWKAVGASTRSPGSAARFDGRFKHYDYNF